MAEALSALGATLAGAALVVLVVIAWRAAPRIDRAIRAAARWPDQP